MYYRFKHFHPLKGEAPIALSMYGEDIVIRARRLLCGWTLAQIKDALGVVNWMMDSPTIRSSHFKILEALALEEPAAMEQARNSRVGFSDIAALDECRPHFDLSGYPTKKALSWSSMFAVLALALIEKACEDEKRYSSWDDPDEWRADWRILDHVSGWLLEATEAICLAEAFAREQRLTKQVTENITNDQKKARSIQLSQAALARHGKTIDASLTLFEFYRDGRFKSALSATRTFCEKHPKQVEHLAPTNRERTLYERLRKLLKARPILRQP